MLVGSPAFVHNSLTSLLVDVQYRPNDLPQRSRPTGFYSTYCTYACTPAHCFDMALPSFIELDHDKMLRPHDAQGAFMLLVH
jgi:hypothetical protein